MATVTGLTAARQLEIEANSITDARLEDGNLILTTHGEVDKNVGQVKGAKGDTGDAATVSVVDTETLNPGEDAEVENVGTPFSAELVFKIPQGGKGDKGDPGNAATISVDSTSTLSPGSPAEVNNVGTPQAAELEFKIPQGVKGDKGDPGTAATIEINDVTTVGPEDPATVNNVGTPTAASLDFEIPQGPQGIPGTDGLDPHPIAVGEYPTLNPASWPDNTIFIEWTD